MRRQFSILSPLFATLLAPTGAWAASVSQNISITVTAGQPVSFTPSSLTFASQNVGTTSSPQTVTITNISGSPLPIYDVSTRVTVGGAYSSDFAQNGACVGTLTVGGTCQVAVTFTPQAAGTRTAVLQFEATSTSPLYSIPLTGTGSDPSTVSAFYVATDGSDSNSGTLAAPFATLSKCQTAMQSSPTIKTCYIRAGTYNVPPVTDWIGNTYALYLTSSDNGETWSYYPPDGYNVAIIDGGASSSTTGIKQGLTINGGSNITINGLQVQHFAEIGIKVYGGTNFYDNCSPGGPNYSTLPAANNNVIINNIVHDTFGGDYTQYICGVGGITVHINAPNTTISHNVVYNMTGMGIFAGTGNGGSGGTLNYLTYGNNVVYNVCTIQSDCGALYAIDVGTSGGSTGITLTNNSVHDCGPVDTNGIYLDDDMSNVTGTGNVIFGQCNMGVKYHGGGNNHFTGNIIDLGALTGSGALIAQANGSTTMTGNTFQNNIVLWNTSSKPSAAFVTGNPCDGNLPCNWNVPTVQNNGYYNYAGGGISSGGTGYSPTYSDANPTTLATPGINCWAHSVSSNSSALQTPVNFPSQPSGWGQAGFWGPPGYSPPQTGTAPADPHSC